MKTLTAETLRRCCGTVQAIWREAFDDGPQFMEAFLDFAAGQGALRMSDAGGEPASLAASLPVGVALEDGQVLAARYIYGLCTSRKWRGQGHARRLVESICQEAAENGCMAVLVQPASLSLAAWYEGMGFVCGGVRGDWLPSGDGFIPSANTARLDASEYLARRESALHGRRHVVYSEDFLAFAEWDCTGGGGGFFGFPDGTLDAVEVVGGAPRVLERLRPGAAPEGAPAPATPLVRWMRDAPVAAADGGVGWMPFTLG